MAATCSKFQLIHYIIIRDQHVPSSSQPQDPWFQSCLFIWLSNDKRRSWTTIRHAGSALRELAMLNVVSSTIVNKFVSISVSWNAEMISWWFRFAVRSLATFGPQSLQPATQYFHARLWLHGARWWDVSPIRHVVPSERLPCGTFAPAVAAQRWGRMHLQGYHHSLERYSNISFNDA